MAGSADELVVSMQFDNKQFEKGVKQSMKSIEDLKDSLSFSDSQKGVEKFGESLDDLSEAGSSGIKDMITNTGLFNNYIGQAAKGSRSWFSELKNMGRVVTQFRLVNSAINKVVSTAKQLSNIFGLNDITKFATGLDNVSAGLTKYQEKISSVKTISNATGLDQKAVDRELQQLNWFTDETSYDFSSMVNNIGKFTSVGQGLTQSIEAMEGIATWAALSGAQKAESNRAMYNLSQAMGVGAVKLMDWKSIENANMATKEFKQSAIEAAAAAGELKEKVDKKTGLKTYTRKGKEVSVQNFNETLQTGWFTSKVLMDVLQTYGGFATKLNELQNKYGMDSARGVMNMIEAARKADSYTDKSYKMMAEKYELSESVQKEIFETWGDTSEELGEKAFKAAQEAKTLTDAIEATKDAVSTGWMNSFQYIFGDLDGSIETWSGFTDVLWDLFAANAEARNDILAMWSGDQFKGRMAFFDYTYDDNGNTGAIRALADAILSVKDAINTGVTGTFFKDLEEYTGAMSDLKTSWAESNFSDLIFDAKKTLSDKRDAMDVQSFFRSMSDEQIEYAKSLGWDENNPVDTFTEEMYLFGNVTKEQFSAMNTEIGRSSGSFEKSQENAKAFRDSLVDAAVEEGALIRENDKLYKMVGKKKVEIQIDTSSATSFMESFDEGWLSKKAFKKVASENEVVGDRVSSLFSAEEIDDYYTSKYFAEKLNNITTGIRDFFNGINAFFQDETNSGNLVKFFGGLASVLKVVTTVVGALSRGVSWFLTKTNLFGKLLAVLGDLGQWVSDISAVFLEKWPAFEEIFGGWFDDLFKFFEDIGLSDLIDKYITTPIKNFFGIKDEKNGDTGLVVSFGNWLDNLKERLSSFDLYKKLNEWKEKLSGWWKDFNNLDIVKKFKDWLRDFWGIKTGDEDPPFLTGFIKLKHTIGLRWRMFKRWWNGLDIIGKIKDWLRNFFGIKFAEDDEIPQVTGLQNFINNIKSKWEGFKGWLKSSGIADFVKKTFSDISAKLKEAFNKLKEIDYGKIFSDIKAKLAPVWEKIKSFFVNFKIGGTDDDSTGNTLFDKIRDYWTMVTDWFNNIDFAQLGKDISAKITQMWNDIKEALGFGSGNKDEVIPGVTSSDIVSKVTGGATGSASTTASTEEGWTLWGALWKNLTETFIPGLIEGWDSVDFSELKNFDGSVFEWIKTLFIKIDEFAAWFQSSNIMSLIQSLFSMGITSSVAKSANNFFGGIGGLFDNIGKGIRFSLISWGKAQRTDKNGNVKDTVGNTFLKIGASIALIAVSLKIIAGIEETDLIKGGIVLGGIALLMVLIGVVLKNATSLTDKNVGMNFLAISVSMLMMILIVKRLAKLNVGEALKGAIMLGLIMKMVSQVIQTTGRDKDTKRTQFMSLAISIGILAIVVKMLGNMPVTKAIKGMSMLAILMVMVRHTFESVNSHALRNNNSAFMALAASMMILAFTVKMLANIPITKAIKGILALEVILVIFARAIQKINKFSGTKTSGKDSFRNITKYASSKTSSSSVQTVGEYSQFGTIIGMAIACYIVAKAVEKLGSMSTGSIVKGTLALVMLIGAFSSAIKKINKSARTGSSTGLFGRSKETTGITSSFGTILAMTVAVVGIAHALNIVANIKVGSLIKGIAAISAVLLAMKLLSKTSSSDKPLKNFLSQLGTLIIFAGTLYTFVTILKLVEKIDTSTMLAFSASFALVFLGFAKGIEILSKISIGGMAKGALALIGLLGIVTGLGYLVQKVKGLDDAGASGGRFIGKIFGGLIGGFVEGMAGTDILAIMANDMKSFMDALEGIHDPNLSISDETVNSVSNLFKIAALMVGTEVLETIGDWVVSFGAEAEMVESGSEAVQPNMFDSFITTIDQMEQVFKALNGKKLELGDFSIDEDAETKIGSLATLMAYVSGGTLISNLASFANKTLFGQDQGLYDQFYNNVIDLSKIFLYLSNISKESPNAFKLENFSIDANAHDKITSLTELMTLVSVSDLVTTITSFVSEKIFGNGKDDSTIFNSNIDDLKLIFDHMSKTGKMSIGEFSIDGRAIKAVESLTELILVIAGGTFMSNLLTFVSASLFGDNNMYETFKKNITSLGQICDALKTTEGFSIGDFTIDSNVSPVLRSLASLIGIISRNGLFTAMADWAVKSLLGDKTKGSVDIFMDNFTDLQSICTELSTMGELSIGDFTIDENVSTVLESLIDVIGKMSKAGLDTAWNDFLGLSFLTGEDSMTNFKESVGKLATALVDYGNAMKAFETLEVDDTTFGKALDVAESITTFFETLSGENTGAAKSYGLGGIFSDEKSSATTYAANVEKIATALNSLATIPAVEFNRDDGFLNAIEMAGKITEVFSTLSSDNDWYNDFVTYASDMYDAIGSENKDRTILGLLKNITNASFDPAKVNSAAYAVEAVSNAAAVLSAANVDEEKAEALSTAIQTLFNGVINVDTMNAIGADIATSLMSGVTAELANDDTTGNSVNVGLNSVITHMNNFIGNGEKGTNFYTLGENMVVGLANGLTDSHAIETLAANARAAARIAYMNAKDELLIESPSKKFAELGYWSTEGYAVGIENNTDSIETATEQMATNAIDSMQNSLGLLSSILMSGIDDQPTIRPVLDLTDVTNGATQLDSMMGNKSYSITGNVSEKLIPDRFYRDIEAENNTEVFDPTSILESIDGLNMRISELGENMANMRVVMNTGALVGQIAPAMDRELGKRAAAM